MREGHCLPGSERGSSMKVHLAKSAGFCLGVKRALRIAADTAAGGGHVFMLGELVHNEHVLRDIERQGITRIRRLSKGEGPRTLLICAHGAPDSVMKHARRLGYSIVDATCPMVRHIHRVAVDMEEHGRTVVVIGDRDHDEVKGIVGQLKHKAIVVDDPSRMPVEKLRRIRKAAVVVQSTQDAAKVGRIVATLRTLVKDLQFHNTICKPTGQKQKEIMSLANGNDVVIVIGSVTSANTTRLFEISKAINPKTYQIGSAKDLKPCWFAGARTVGVSAGASTPDSLTNEVAEKLSRMKVASAARVGILGT